LTEDVGYAKIINTRDSVADPKDAEVNCDLRAHQISQQRTGLLEDGNASK
jgi:hypothetical protein